MLLPRTMRPDPSERALDEGLLTRAFERVVAGLFLVLALPLIALLALYVLAVDGWPPFHSGLRLGRGKRPFVMWKLRTLRVGAEQQINGALFGHRHDLTIRGGRFLRDSRLDELPQLLNVVRGEMSFIGPRPERPQVYATQCADIPGYERRFLVRPGLIGISQLFTPHGTPKRYRTLIDNGGLRRRLGFAMRQRLLVFTIWVVFQLVWRRATRQIGRFRALKTGIYREKRHLRRIVPSGAVLHTGARALPLVDMNEEALVVECGAEPAVALDGQLVLDIPVGGKGIAARRRARIRGDVLAGPEGRDRPLLVIRYEPCSPCSEYMIHQYFLRDSLAPPRRRRKARVPGSQRPKGKAPRRPTVRL